MQQQINDQHEPRTIYTDATATRLTFAASTSTDTGTIGTLRGYALVWNVLSSDRGGYKVRLLPGSAVFGPLTHALFQHAHAGGPLGDTGSGTLRILPADDYGQPVEIDLPRTQLGADVLELVRTGRVRGMSFQMGKPEADAVVEGSENVLVARRYTVAEVTVTAIPAFSETTIKVVETVEAQPQQLSNENNVDEKGKDFTEHRMKLMKLALEFMRL